MRIDGYSNAYPLDRSVRQGSAAAARDLAREYLPSGQDRLEPVNDDASPQLPPVERPANGAQSRNELFPSYAREPLELYQPALSNRAAQALASYNATASMPVDLEPMQILGLDLYA